MTQTFAEDIMYDRQNLAWSIALRCLLGSFVGFVVFGALNEAADPDTRLWLSAAMAGSGFLFLGAGLTIWWYAIRFYMRVNHELGLTRSVAYLLIVVGCGWIAAFVFIWLEGQDRFFGRAS